MSFEQPWMLWGLAAGAIPLIIHLSHRRWAQEIPFGAIDFLLLSDKRLARRFRLRQLLVLLLRTLLIAAVPLALAKPYTASPAPLPVATASPTSVVLIVDNSASMSYRVEDETLLERAIERLSAVIDELPQRHNVELITAARPARRVVGSLTFDHRLVRDALRAVPSTERSTDIFGALRLAERILSESRLPRRQVILATDLTKAGWPDLAPPWVTPHPPALHLFDVVEGEALPNVGITELRAEEVRGGPELGVELHVTVRNQSDAPWHDLVTVDIDGRTVTGYLKVPQGESATKTFRLDAERSRTRAGRVEIAGDALALDDARDFAVGVPSQLRVLVLNGAPRSVPYLDEVFFLERALRPERGAGASIVPIVMTVDEFSAAQLPHTDVVVLANVGQLADEQVAALEGFVRKGGGLLVAAGDNLTPEASEALSPLLPLPVRGIRHAGPAVGADGAIQIAPPTVEHAVFTSFLRYPASSLYRARVHRYILLEPSAGEASVLLSYTDGAPALAERRLGEGRVMMVTTTIDRDWTDLPIRTSYLPLVQQIVRAIGPAEAAVPNAVFCGDPVRVPVPRQVVSIEVRRSPDGEPVRYEWEPEAATAAHTLQGLDHAGLYEITFHGIDADSVGPRHLVAVGPDPEELDLSRVSAEAVLASLRVPGAGLAPGTPDAEPLSGADARSRHWPPLLIALFALLLFETWLVVRG